MSNDESHEKTRALCVLHGPGLTHYWNSCYVYLSIDFFYSIGDVE